MVYNKLQYYQLKNYYGTSKYVSQFPELKSCMIIYDFDGTIADTLEAAVLIYNQIAWEKGFKLITEDNLEFLRAYGPKKVAQELGVSLYQIPVLAYRAKKELRRYIPNLKVQPGMEEVLSQLKSLEYRQSILTTNSEENVRAFLRKNHIDIFDRIYCGKSVFGKGAAFKKLLQDEHLTPQEVVYVGDEVRDIEAARQARIKVISVSWGFNNREALEKNHPDALVDKPGELVPVIKSMQMT